MKEPIERKKARPSVMLLKDPITLYPGRQDALRVEGVKKILVCTENKVSLRLRNGYLHVFGKELACITYTCGSVEIVGVVERVLNERGEAREDSHL